MEKSEMSCNKSAALMTFLTGLGVGIALTALLAPRSGAATRRIIGRKAEEGKDWLKDQAAAAEDYVKGQGEQLRSRVKVVPEAIGRS
jgi:hypothetical protein